MKVALFCCCNNLNMRCNTFDTCNPTDLVFAMQQSFSAFFSTGDYKNNNLFLVKLGWIFYTRPSNGLWWLIGDVSVGFRLAQLKLFEGLQLLCLQDIWIFRASKIFKIFKIFEIFKIFKISKIFWFRYDPSIC